MTYFTSLLEKRNIGQLFLTILFILYLILGFQMPAPVANTIDTLPGKIGVTVVALLLFAYSNPVLGVLGLLVAYEIVKKSAETTGSAALEMYYPTEEKKWSPFTPAHQFPYTLEQEIVKKMAPQKVSDNNDTYTFKPLVENLHDAAPAHFNGVL